MPIRRHLGNNTAFDPAAIKEMSEALEQACAALDVNGHVHEREIIATRIIDLARNGVIDAKTLSDRVVESMRSL